MGFWEIRLHKSFQEIHVKGDELLLYTVNIPILNLGQTSVIDIHIASYVPFLLYQLSLAWLGLAWLGLDWLG